MDNSQSNKAIGLNQNVQIGDTEYHVQTEDLNQRTLIRTQIFIEGVVCKCYELDYSPAIGKANLTTLVSKALKAFHSKVVNRLKQGDNAQSIQPCSIVKIGTTPKQVTPIQTVVKKKPAEIWDTLISLHKRPKAKYWDKIVTNNRASNGR